MKKVFFTLIVFLSCSFIVKANYINNITMDISIDKNGNAHIEEKWYTYNDEGTENYRQYLHMADSVVSNFKVADKETEYEFLSNWDINASFKDKKYKNGINYVDDGVELCWGISKYGARTYKISYDISNMVIETSDGAQVFYWTLLPKSTNQIKQYDITIRTEQLLPDDTDVWGFGAYGKLAYVNEGVIKLVGEDSLNSDEQVIALVKFKDNIFDVSTKIDKTFDDLYKMAKEGSTAYTDPGENGQKKISLLGKIAIILGNTIPYIITALIVIFAAKKSGNNKYFSNLTYNDPNMKSLPKDVPMFREIPCNKDIFAANYISYLYKINKDDKNFIGCLILKWLKDDIITVNKDSESIILKYDVLPENYTSYNTEIELYGWMVDASEEKVLTIKNFKKYCQKHYNQITSWNSNSFNDGKTACEKLQYLVTDVNNAKKDNVTDKMYEEGKKLLGLKNFLSYGMNT